MWFLIWTTVAIVLASHQVASRPFVDGRSLSWRQAILVPLLLSYYWGILSPLIFKTISRFPLERETWKAGLFSHLFLALSFYSVFISIGAGIIFWISSSPSYAAAMTDWEITGWTLVEALSRITFHTSMLIYVGTLAVGQTVDFYRKFQNRESLAAQLKIDLVSEQLEQLRAQLHPHFLFNTLSAITTLIDREPEKAKTTVVRLGELLRMALDNPSAQTRTLEKELAFLRKYIEIQKIRFCEKLIYNEQIDPSVFKFKVPFLLLQPLVENAIKHGVCESPQPCTVRLEISRDPRGLVIKISDTGPGHGAQEIVDGVGLRNTKKRLEHLYGDRYEFIIQNCENGFCVSITLPVNDKAII